MRPIHGWAVIDGNRRMVAHGRITGKAPAEQAKIRKAIRAIADSWVAMEPPQLLCAKENGTQFIVSQVKYRRKIKKPLSKLQVFDSEGERAAKLFDAIMPAGYDARLHVAFASKEELGRNGELWLIAPGIEGRALDSIAGRDAVTAISYTLKEIACRIAMATRKIPEEFTLQVLIIEKHLYREEKKLARAFSTLIEKNERRPHSEQDGKPLFGQI